ncbi:MAG TPA: SRPBCC domain-containing protein [Candidatus Limnocylindria bacterium]|jgi:uncharacterized protein YndB with AHSA1/START domain/DNA-binding transcriptional ArsR family regulator
MEQDDALFRALADPSRRLLLDRLYERDGQTLGELETALPQMSRIGVMKHLRILERADLVVSHRAGRRRLHYLNPVPIRRLHDRWLDKFRARAADALLALQSFIEEPTMGNDTAAQAEPRFVSQIFIRATPDQVWHAITESEFTTRYYYESAVESDWKAGSPYRYTIGEMEAITGTVLEADPPRRLVLTFDARWDDEVGPDAPSRLTWEIEETAPGITKVTTIHDEFPSRTATFHQVAGGAPYILSALKSLLETGAPLEPVREEAPASA